MVQTAETAHSQFPPRPGAPPQAPAAWPRPPGCAERGGPALAGPPDPHGARLPLEPWPRAAPGATFGPKPEPAAPRRPLPAGGWGPAPAERPARSRDGDSATQTDATQTDGTRNDPVEFDAALWQRLLDFRIDGPGAELPFLARLARERAGWSLADARAAWFEYLRFLYLACRAGHPVTPSNEVDAVWHLHLVYTQSYWQELCPRVLGLTLHHGPTRGGSAEARRYLEQYRQTLEAYRRVFHAEPPARFWPPPAERFGQRFVSVDRRRVLLVPRPLAAWSLVLAVAAALAAAFLGQRWA